MKVFLAIMGLLALLGGVGVFGNSKSAVHEIEAFILILIFAVCMGSAGIIEAVDKLRGKSEAPPNK